MPSFTIRVLGSLIVCGILGVPGSTTAQERSAGAILREIDAIKLPEVDESRMEDEAYVREFKQRRGEIRVHRADLIGELYRIDPENSRLVKLLPVRWRSFSGRLVGPDNDAGVRDLTGELDEVLARPGNAPLKVEAAYLKAWLAVDPLDRIGSVKGAAAKAKAVDAFIAFAPQDQRGAELLRLLGQGFPDDRARQKALLIRIVRDYPGARQAEAARGKLGRLDAIGKPFDLTFKDAITGAEVSMKGLRGKVVVVDFWATWCGPCVQDMPRLKQLHAKYRDQGVAFVGVSLDYPEADGGLASLKAFVAKNEIPWPHYYSGEGLVGNFARDLGIDSIPAVFVVDREGKIASSDAGDRLETLIPELLDRKATPGDGAAGRRSPTGP